MSSEPAIESFEPHVALARRLLAQIDGAPQPDAFVGEVPSAHYTSRERFEREQERLFRRLPQIVGLSSEIAEPGACTVASIGGVSLLVVRGDDGVVRAHRNACRHRGTQLVSAPCKKRAFVCPYHGWTYDPTGRLIHVPHDVSFGDKLDTRRSLVSAFAAERGGFVWAALEPFDVETFLGPIGADLDALAIPKLHFYRRAEREVRGNWKLIVDAFLDGYHIRQLHRNTIYRFFLDARAETERVGDHIRALTGRRALVERREELDKTTLRDLATPSYLLFPNVILILHPDYLSVLVMTPLAEDRTSFSHTMLIAGAPRNEEEADHWEKSFQLIDQGVFQSEDLAVVESMQNGLATGANETVLFGKLEYAALWFHAAIDRMVSPLTK